MMIKHIKNYKGLGFVEALIALSVSGVVAVVLMGISAEAIRELRKLDMQDSIAQVAVSTAVQLQDLAIKQAYQNPEGNIFYETTMQRCYTLDSAGVFNPNEGFNQTAVPREEYMNSLAEGEDEYFRVMCVEHKTDSDRRKILVKIISGSNRVEGKVTNNKDVKDYEHFAIINL
ncbi:MAG: hypothetical protein RBS01_01355 [Candidatus Dojkabacteria bacterium]|jgi:hypothetical protein|nr:hypothetical protein [Candidatus Dojkabacteria bacterium]